MVKMNAENTFSKILSKFSMIDFYYGTWVNIKIIMKSYAYSSDEFNISLTINFASFCLKSLLSFCLLSRIIFPSGCFPRIFSKVCKWEFVNILFGALEKIPRLTSENLLECLDFFNAGGAMNDKLESGLLASITGSENETDTSCKFSCFSDCKEIMLLLPHEVPSLSVS